ncbi:MAG: cytochrome c oxidase subunit II [Chloroflexi bacterium]|nr:cytochrome c oxidase subunit II [Chloroflexota bacterium]
MNQPLRRLLLSPRTLFVLLLSGIGVVGGGYLAGEMTPLLFPAQASAEARQVDDLFRFLMIIAGAIWFLVQGLIVFAIIAYRRRPGDDADGPSWHGNRLLEFVWTFIPSVIVFVLVVFSYQVWVDITTPKADENQVLGYDVVPVFAEGQQFAWRFTYSVTLPDSGREIKVVSPSLHTFVGQNVHLTMETADVIHSFWVPAFRIKQDLLPGYTTDVRFTPTLATEVVWENGEPVHHGYPIVCAELCGSGHGSMRSQVIVHATESDFVESFLQPEIDFIINPPTDPVLIGQKLLADNVYGCASCHTLETPHFSWDGNQAPVLNGIGTRASLRIAGYSAKDYLLESLGNSPAFLVPGDWPAVMTVFQAEDSTLATYMPLGDQQAIAAYLCTVTADPAAEPACEIELTAPTSLDAPEAASEAS